MKSFFRFFNILVFLFATSCDAPNSLTEYSSTDKESALLYAARKAVDNSQWDKAIGIITQEMSALERERVSSKETLMLAYGGKCGIRFFDLVNQLKNTQTGTVFEIMLKLYANKALNNTSCEQSYLTLQSLGDNPADRSKNSNIYAALLGMTQVSATLKAKFDTDNQGGGDGYADGVIDACVNTNANLRLTDDDMKTIAIGMGLFLQNVSAIGSDIAGGSIIGSLQDVEQLCSVPIDVTGIPGGITVPPEFLEPIECLSTKASQVTPKHVRLIRRMVESSVYGFSPANYGGNACDISVLTPDLSDPLNPKLVAQCCPLLEVP